MADLIQIGIDVRTNIKQATADLDKMGGSVVNNIRTIDRLESEVKQLNSALSKGSATEAAYAKGMRQINNELSLFQQRATKAAQIEKKFGSAAASGGKSMNRFNVALQQGGFQLQDFAVQLQSGTSFFTAFGQQGSQFAGIFGPGGAVIGAVIAIGSAIGGIAAKSFMASRSVKEFGEQLEETSSVMEDYISLASKSDDVFASLFKSSKTALSQTSQAAKDLLLIAKTEALDSIRGLGKSLADTSTEAGFWAKVMLNTDRTVTGNLLNIDTQLKGNITAWKNTGKEVQSFIDAVREIGTADSIDGMYQSALKARDIFKQTVDVTGEMTEDQKSFWKELSTTILNLETMGATVEAMNGSWSDTSEAIDAATASMKLFYEYAERDAEAQDKRTAAVDKIEDALANTLLIESRRVEIAQAGANLDEVLAKHAREDFILKKKSENIVGNNLAIALEAYDNAVAALQVESDRNATLSQRATAEKAAAAANAAYDKAAAAADAKAKAEAQKLLELQIKISATPAYEPMSALAVEAAKSQAEMIKIFETTAALKEELGESAFEALRLAGVDMASPIDAAAKAAARLAADLNISLAAALEMRRMASDEEAVMSQGVVTGSVTDRFGVSDLLNMGYTKEYLIAIGKMTDETKKLKDGMTDAERAAEELRKELERPMVNAIESVSNAFGDFIADGLRDFKSFASSIVNSFKSMIAQMIATAARNKIMLSLGMGGTAFAEQAVAGQVAGVGANTFFGGPIGSAVGSFAGGGVAGSGFLGGLGAAGSSAMAGYASGGLAGGASGLFSVGANAAAAGGGMMATLGAAVPVIGAVALAVGFLSKKVKVLDEGARFSANGLDVLGESMKKLKTTRFFGLSKKTSTEYEASDPITQALEGQLSVVKSLARQLDFSTDALKDFTYEVEFSTKGLSEAEIAQKYALELQKFGDAAAGAIANGATIADLMMRADAPRRRLAELLQSDPLVGYNIEVMQQSFNASMKEFKKAFESMPEIISENMDQAVSSVSVGFGAIAGAADAVRDYLYTTLGNLNEILGYSAGGPMGNLARIGDTLDRILEPAEQAVGRLRSAFGDQVQAFNEVRDSGLATTEQLQQMSAAMSAAASSIAQATLPISTIRSGYSTLSSAISDLFSSQIEDALELAFPEAAKSLSAFVKGIIGTVSEGSVSEFEAAFVNLADAFGEGKVNASDFNTAMEVMNQVFRGNISLTEEYTTTQQKAVDKLSNAFNTLKEGLESVVGTIQSALETLTGQRQDLLNTTATRDKSLSYLRGIAATGQIPTGDQSSFNAAVQAVSNIETTGFRTATEMLRYIGQTSGVLSSIQSQAEQQLTDAEVQVKAILKIQDTNETSAEALVSIDSAIKEFLGAGGRIPQFASGGYHSGGLRIVGENGPELEATGPSRIIPNGKISVGSDSELRREVAEMRVDLKSALVQIAKNTRKSSDTLNKFDYQGLPNSRGY